MRKPVQLYEIVERFSYSPTQTIDYQTGIIFVSKIDAQLFCATKNSQINDPSRKFTIRLLAGNVYDNVQEALDSSRKLGLGTTSSNFTSTDNSDEPKA